MAVIEKIKRKSAPSPSSMSSSSAVPTLSPSATKSNIPSSGNLRIRPTRKLNSKNAKTRQIKDECYSAFLPILIITAVWCFCCWLMAWMTLYQSFSDSTNNSGVFSKRKDILAIKLRQFLGEKKSVIDDNQSTSVLGRITNPQVLEKIHEMLVKETQYPQLTLAAYMEPPLQLGGGVKQNTNNNSESVPNLNLRTHSPQDLQFTSFPYELSSERGHYDATQPTRFGACSREGAQWTFPTFHPPSLDHYFEGNVFRKKPMFEKRWELAMGISGDSNLGDGGYCPVDADPFLPWIHDAFPSNDGKYIAFIIGNKRRCDTDPNTFQEDLQNLEPQVALMQPVPIKRLKDNTKSADLMQKIWQKGKSNNQQHYDTSQSFLLGDDQFEPPRYLLATSLDDADGDGKYTRYICRFHTILLEDENGTDKAQPILRNVVLGETLSNYPYNPEHANYRKRGSNPMLTPLKKGHDEQIWNNVHEVRCPVPEKNDNGVEKLVDIIASGKSVLNGIPSIYVDLIPIRTPARIEKEGYGVPGVQSTSFDPKKEWGDSHLLPLVDASGRWANIPICNPPQVDERLKIDTSKQKSTSPESLSFVEIDIDGKPDHLDESKDKTHFLVACVWAARSFSTRGQTATTDSSTSDRLLEFLTYHLQLAGFDHVYVYDNSDSTTLSENTLANVTSMFSPDQVTRVPWPHRICNNNRPAHSNPGVRSSQYAAEFSCRARYGPDTTWMASLDVDEYLVPVGKQWRNLRHWLEHVTETEQSTKILSFFQTRSLPNVDVMVPYEDDSDKSCKPQSNSASLTRHKWGSKMKGLVANETSILQSTCAMKDPAKTYMETYNCEPTTHPKPDSYAWRAKKQIYRPDFVLNHFVHYSVVTRLILDKPLEESPRFVEKMPYERRVNERTEGYLLHSKTTGPDSTSQWHTKCPQKGDTNSKKDKCAVGIPDTKVLGEDSVEKEVNVQNEKHGNVKGVSSLFESTCYRHARVMNEWVPKLEKALKTVSGSGERTYSNNI